MFDSQFEVRTRFREAQLEVVHLIMKTLADRRKNHQHVLMTQTTNLEVTTGTLLAITATILESMFTPDQQRAILDAFADSIKHQNRGKA